jgi:flagellar biosynthesis GTPase FlhF
MNNKKSATQKPFCKVCQDAGKSEKEYTSHYVRSEPGPNGKVVCPTLLSQSCKYCDGCGHTPKFCPVLAAHKAAEEKALKQAALREIQEKKEAEKAAPKPAAAKKQSNVFAALCSDSDSESEKKVSKKVSKKKVSTQKAAEQKQTEQKKPAEQQKPAKKITREEEFPQLLSSQPAASALVASVSAKSHIKSIISKMCPGLEVADKMPPVEKYYVPQAKIIHKKAELEPKIACRSEIKVSDFVEALAAAPYRAPMLASQMNWAMEDSDDSDEEW